MSEQNISPVEALRDLHTIRDILMGQEITDYAARFAQIDALFLTSEQATAERFDAEHKHIAEQVAQLNERIDALTQQTNARLDALEQALNAKIAALNERVSAVSTSDKAELGKMLAAMAQRLAAE